MTTSSIHRPTAAPDDHRQPARVTPCDRHRDGPASNVDFYTRALGLRGEADGHFDAPDTYHLYYGDSRPTVQLLTFLRARSSGRQVRE